MIEFLQTEGESRYDDLLKIEWGYLSLLDRHSSQTRPKTLFNALKSDPSWYVDLIKVVYRERGDDSEPQSLTPQEENLHRNLHRKIRPTFYHHC